MAFFKKRTPEKEPIVIDERLQHIAFIMDGNGRWAQRRGMQRPMGHIEGMKSFDRLMVHCRELGIPHVTVYAFSTENWKRPKPEVDTIMNLLSSYMDRGINELEENRTAYHFIGDKSGLPDKLREKAEYLEKISAHLPLTLNIALNYGAHSEMVHAVNTLIASGKTEVTADDINGALYTAHSPYPDLLVRTAGEYRLSNFLLWQLAYSELYFTDILWPDLSNDQLDDIIRSFYNRNRTYGGLKGGDKGAKTAK
ncbi:MAG: di-trans,poly-cis-decaprenylcistransferase [Clostridia bacterium]|nr:di-trans,poly-cis-decaprenylcistransferase [Clostridia bacterium]MBQ5649238.1 di-trans,poly-cis-decaprenylcistransferase [Clostridia bacterium]MBQ5808622.1 di-trans,poly-cis-decaprenylcistransferase [Clostridia bacterium]